MRKSATSGIGGGSNDLMVGLVFVVHVGERKNGDSEKERERHHNEWRRWWGCVVADDSMRWPGRVAPVLSSLISKT